MSVTSSGKDQPAHHEALSQLGLHRGGHLVWPPDVQADARKPHARQAQLAAEQRRPLHLIRHAGVSATRQCIQRRRQILCEEN